VRQEGRLCSGIKTLGWRGTAQQLELKRTMKRDRKEQTSVQVACRQDGGARCRQAKICQRVVRKGGRVGKSKIFSTTQFNGRYYSDDRERSWTESCWMKKLEKHRVKKYIGCMSDIK